MVWQRLTMQNASSVVFSHNAFSGPNVCSVIFSTAGKPQHPPLATEARTQAATTLTRAIGPQWAAVWRSVRDPLSTPWASSPGGVVWFIGQGGSRTSPPRRRSRKACGQYGKRDPGPRGCREPQRMDGRRPPPYLLWRVDHLQIPPLQPSGCWTEGLWRQESGRTVDHRNLARFSFLISQNRASEEGVHSCSPPNFGSHSNRLRQQGHAMTAH